MLVVRTTEGQKWWKNLIADTNDKVNQIAENVPCYGPGYDILLTPGSNVSMAAGESEGKYCLMDYYYFNPNNEYYLFNDTP